MDLKKKMHSLLGMGKSGALVGENGIPRSGLQVPLDMGGGAVKVNPVFFAENLGCSLFEVEEVRRSVEERGAGGVCGVVRKLEAELECVWSAVFLCLCCKRRECEGELEKVWRSTEDVERSYRHCLQLREELGNVHGEFSLACLELLAAVRRRQQTLRLLKGLNIIRTLRRTDSKLQQLIRTGNYPNAIHLIIECQNVSLAFRQFYSINQLSIKLQDTLAMTEEALDVSLAQQIVNFDDRAYTDLYEAYSILEKKQVSLDQLLMHLISAVHNTSWKVVFIHTSLRSNANDNVQETFDEICGRILPDEILTCLLRLCSSLWNIMHSYRKIVDWHLLKSDKYAYKLKNGLTRVWADVGHLFCGSESDTLQESIKQQCWNYFVCYHKKKLKEIQRYLDHETWKLTSTRSNFNVSELPEFNHLKDIGIKRSMIGDSLLDKCPFQNYYLSKYSRSSQLRNTKLADQHYTVDVDSDDSDVPDDLKKDFLEEEEIIQSIKFTKNREFITETSLAILRLCGSYLELMKLLDRIAERIFGSFCQLIELYAFTVHHFFTQSLNEHCRDLICSFELNNHLSRIEDSLFASKTLDSPKFNQIDATPENLFGLNEKMIAVESVLFLGRQLIELKSTISGLISAESVQHYYNASINFLPELRKPIYMSVCGFVSNYDHITYLMSRVSWDVKEVQSQHSHYVDVMLREQQMFSIRLDTLEQNANFDIYPEIWGELWNLNLLHASNTFVDGFSNAKNCSNEGRALMQLDYRHFVMKIEKVTSMKPAPFQNYVTNYIKAFYIPETELEDWLKRHTEYKSKHLESLANCIVYKNNRTKKKINSLLADLSVRLRK
uniref:Coiled-coil domain-containing protein 132 n=1 Tax=Lepeophtheirus salmonis TaxID=72036 RepID=A0A0K2V6X7_LEPSM